jgi:glucokinase
MGAGTGFGVAHLVPCADGHALVASEGGHAGFAPANEDERRLLDWLAARHGRVSIETVLSGSGLVEIDAALHEFSGIHARHTPEEIAQRTAADPHSISAQALEKFCNIFGAVAGDIALVSGARGGVFLAGGVAMRNREALKQSRFAERFADKGAMSDYVSGIPVYLITAEHAALKGAALWFAKLNAE